MLTAIHILLTYVCNFECEHCFLHCGPKAKGTFTLGQLRAALEQIGRIGTIEMVYFEGGEPFQFYPLMLKGIELARAAGFKTGIVTNGYWATSEEDALLWLGPLADLGVSRISVSDDTFHYGEIAETPAKRAVAAAARAGISSGAICIDRPRVEVRAEGGQPKGTPVVGGGVRFRGRAVETLTAGLPLRPAAELTECPHEDLRNPSRVHIDSYGTVHLCQGLSMGNMWQTPLATLVRTYDPDSHPICGPLLRGGPAALAEAYGVSPAPGYVEECHLCYLVRLALMDRFPAHLGPRQAYGLT